MSVDGCLDRLDEEWDDEWLMAHIHRSDATKEHKKKLLNDSTSFQCLWFEF